MVNLAPMSLFQKWSATELKSQSSPRNQNISKRTNPHVQMSKSINSGNILTCCERPPFLCTYPGLNENLLSITLSTWVQTGDNNKHNTHMHRMNGTFIQQKALVMQTKRHGQTNTSSLPYRWITSGFILLLTTCFVIIKINCVHATGRGAQCAFEKDKQNLETNFKI